ncbi:MAG: hypothetical protein J5639_09210, partial [Bacteroidales bacterium]|nr:hypothetical protein [Bacteroidales bacterium]
WPRLDDDYHEIGIQAFSATLEDDTGIKFYIKTEMSYNILAAASRNDDLCQQIKGLLCRNFMESIYSFFKRGEVLISNVDDIEALLNDYMPRIIEKGIGHHIALYEPKSGNW